MIPDYQKLMRPVLEFASDGEVSIGDAVQAISDKLQLSDEEKATLLPSGKQTIIANRVHWARSYLKQAGLVKNTRRGYYKLTDRGREALSDRDLRIDNSYLERFEDYQDFKSRSRSTDAGNAAPIDDTESTGTPDENLRAAHQRMEAGLASDLLDQIRGSDPAFFEQLIVQLLIAMGYGGTSEEAGKALGQSGDDGVDGVIDQDPLGVDQIYLQAKRYAQGNNIGPAAIRDFYGALSLKRATKGIFVTTSKFSPAAAETAEKLGSRIVLIDGPQLARLMIKYSVGCRDEEVLHIKKLDNNYFNEL